MAGKRLLDAALFFNASRTITGKHVRIRREQLDVWSKTSTIAKAVKNQTDRVTLTAQAAVALAQRLNESSPSPSPAPQTTQSTRAGNEDIVPRNEVVDDTDTDHSAREGFQQDHHYKRSEQNATQQPPPADEIDVRQEKPARYPTADGSIPPAGSPINEAESRTGSDDVGNIRATEPPTKDPVTEEGREDVGGIKPHTSDSSTIPIPQGQPTTEIPNKEAIPDQEQLPEGINTDIFYSPRVSKLLRQTEKKDASKSETQPRGSKTPIDKTPQREGQDHETFNVRESGSSKLTEADKPILSGDRSNTVKTSDAEMQDLASDIAADAQLPPQAEDQVSTLIKDFYDPQADILTTAT